jgi:hypothetical protein
MFGVRDAVWSIVICALVTVFVQCRPAWSARRFLTREADAGFDEAFAGYRFVNGHVITPAGRGVHSDALTPRVTFRRLEIKAERVAWNGSNAEFVVRYMIEVDGDSSPTREVHVQVERRGPRWVYTRFDVRGMGDLVDPNGSSPWKRALKPS